MNTINEGISNAEPLVQVDEEYIVAGEDAFLNKYKHLRITMDRNIPEPTPIISIDGHTISTSGNITMISGDSKAGKSAFCSIILAGAVRGHNNDYDGLDSLVVDGNEAKKAVIHIDTEQAQHNHYKNLKYAVLKRSGRDSDSDPSYFYSYNIRVMDLEDRKNFTKELLVKAARADNGIHLIVIDGIADYISSVNDEQASNEMVHFFDKLSIKYECPIIAIVHLNPGDNNKPRGHLGSQLQRKAESVLHIKKDKAGISYCEPSLLRNADKTKIPVIQFEFNEDKKYHTYAGIRSNSNSSNARAGMFRGIAEQIFSNEPISYGDAVIKIQEIVNISERTAKTYMKLMAKTNNFIRKNDEGKYVSLL